MEASIKGPSETPPAREPDARRVPPLWAERMYAFRQGDVLDVESIPYKVSPNVVAWIETPHGAAVITQTCDLVLWDRPSAQLVPIVELSESDAKASRGGRRPHLVHLPALGDLLFADLTYVATVKKEFIADADRLPGVNAVEEERKFGQRVGRRFSRYAFPDEVTPWLRPLKEVAESKALKEASPVGWALQQVATLRLKCEDDWDRPPYALTLYVVLEPGVLPNFPSDVEIPSPSPRISQWLYKDEHFTINRKHSEIAELLQRETDLSLTSADRYWLWSALAQTWADLCKAPKGSSQDILSAVAGESFESEVMSTEEFTFEDFRHSEEIDLDHISAPLPF